MPNTRRKGLRRTHALGPNPALTPATTVTSSTRSLDWAHVSKTCQHFVNSVRLLSLPSKQQAHDDLNDDKDAPEDVRADDADDNSQNDWDPDLDDDWDIWDFWPEERQRTEESLLLNLARLRNRFLDRLSEVLARIKDPPEAAKQISSPYLEEFGSGSTDQSVQIRVSKNDGFSEQDEEYLETLKSCLEQISQRERPVDEVRDIMLNDVLRFARPRLTHYIKILKNEFNREVQMPSDNLSNLERFVTAQGHLPVKKQWEDSTWRSYEFPLPMCEAGQARDGEASSWKRPKSFQQIHQNAGQIFDDVKQFCNPATPESEKMSRN